MHIQNHQKIQTNIITKFGGLLNCVCTSTCTCTMNVFKIWDLLTIARNLKGLNMCLKKGWLKTDDETEPIRRSLLTCLTKLCACNFTVTLKFIQINNMQKKVLKSNKIRKSYN